VLLSITDGANTVTFSHSLSSGISGVTVDGWLRQFTPAMPELDSVEAPFGSRDGGEQPRSLYRNPTERISAALAGAYATTTAAYRTLTALLLQARQRQAGAAVERVYLEYQRAVGETTWRSEVLSGRASIDSSDVPFGLQGLDGTLLLDLAITRRYYWEGELAELPLANGSGSGTGGRVVYNHSDEEGYGGEHENYVDINGDDVDGDLPTPLRLELMNLFDDSRNLAVVWIAENLTCAPATLPHVIEAEDADGAVTVADAPAASGGYWAQYDFAGEGVEQEAFRWTLSSALLAAAGGSRLQILGRWNTDPAHYYRLRLEYQNLVLWEGPVVAPDPYLSVATMALGAPPLPPYGVPEAAAEIDLTLRMIPITASGSIFLDYLQVTPGDAFAQLRSTAYGAEYSDTVVWDAIEGRLYTEASGGNVSNWTRLGSVAMEAWPGRDVRLYFLQHTDNAYQASIMQALSVRAYYRPRQLLPL
jgi:hypothetical protein